MKIRLLALLAALTLLLSGCAAQEILMPAATLPPVQTTVAAPVGDAALSQESVVALYLPSRDAQRLICVYETLTLNRGRHPAEAVVRAMLAHEGTETAAPLGGGVSLYLSGSDPVELSGGVCTVNLGSSALQLSEDQFYTVSLALAAALCELEGIQAVNILVSGQAIALDVSGHLPLGCVTAHAGMELPVLWEQMTARRTPVGGDPADTPLASAAALYFPLADASGVTPEIRSLNFAGQSPAQLAETLLATLSSGAKNLQEAAPMPDLSSLLTQPPQIHALSDGGRMLTLHFIPDLERELREANVDTACFAAALTLTLTTYMPSLTSVQMLTGDSALTSLYNPALGSQLFPGGVMRREHFADYVRQPTELWFIRNEELQSVLRAMRSVQAHHPRAVLLELMKGPTPLESATGISPALPSGLSDADILGIAIDDDTLLINLSDRFAQAIRDSGMDQQRMARSLTATLCRSTDTRRLRLFFGGMAVESLGGNVCWSGELILTPYLTDNAGGA